MIGPWNVKQISDLTSTSIHDRLGSSAYDRRGAFPIAIVDDKDFPYEENLKANNFTTKYLGDIRSLSEIEEFNIILCDLQGTGTKLNQRGQGAFIIDEIKRNHPEKFVVAYTGGALDDTITLRAQETADFFLKKDADIDDWRDILDEIIENLADTAQVWRRQRDALIEADVPTLDILKLEDAFVRSVQSGSSATYLQKAADTSLSKDLRAIAQSLIASGIFKLLVAS